MGTTYVERKIYEEVNAFSVSARNVAIPSTATVVEGIYYIWNPGLGFQGTGWQETLEGSPMAVYDFGAYSGDTTVDKINNYIEQYDNLDAVFLNWSNYLDGLDAQTSMVCWDKFYQAVPTGCKMRE